MNVQEFAKLKAGDRVESMNGGVGTITETTGTGIRVCWGEPGSTTFAFSINSTAWMHWTVMDRVNSEALAEHVRDSGDVP